MRIAFLLLLPLSLSQTCNKYMCAPSNVTMSPETCVYGEDPVFYLQQCTDSHFSYCPPITSSGNSTCQVPPSPPLFLSSYPNEPCEFDMDCVYGTCGIAGLCSAANANETCSKDAACNPGLYCNTTTLTCVSQAVAGASCSNDTMCQNGFGCNLGSNGEGTCTAYMSISSGSPVRSCINGANSLCENQLCYQQSQGTWICAGNVTTVGAIPKQCKSSANCVPNSYFNQVLNGTCSCSFGVSGNQYCSLFPGDYPASQLLQLAKQWYSSSAVNNCNTFRRNATACVNTYFQESDAVAFLYFYLYTSSYAAVQNMDQCSSTIYNQAYFQAYESYQNWTTHPEPLVSSAMGLAIVGGWLALLLGT